MSGVADARALHGERPAARARPRSASGRARADRPQLSTVAQLDGPFPDGRVQALRLPINGRIGKGGSFAFGTLLRGGRASTICRIGALQLGPTRLPVCPIGPAIISQAARRTGPARQRAVQRPGAQRPARQARRLHLHAARRPDRRQAVRLQPLGAAARQDRPRRSCSMPRGCNGSFAGSGHQRHLRRRARDDRQRPAAAQRRVGQAGGCITAT